LVQAARARRRRGARGHTADDQNAFGVHSRPVTKAANLFRAITSGRRLERQTVCEAKRLSRNMRPSRAPSREQTRAVPEGILWSGKRIGALALADIDHLAGSQSSNFR